MQQPGPGGYGEGQGGPQPPIQPPSQPPMPPPMQPPGQPSQPSWQGSPPPGPGVGTPGAPGAGMPAWTSNLTSTAPVAGPAGYFYADVPNRAIAYIVDAVILFIALFIIIALSTAIFGVDTIVGKFQSTTSLLVAAILWGLVSAAYFIYSWTAMRGTPGMKVLGMQIGNEQDGSTIPMNQAVLRYVVLFGPAVAAQLINAFAPGIGIILNLLAFIWFIALLVTTAQSPTKQGIHDKQARTMVVKAGRSVS